MWNMLTGRNKINSPDIQHIIEIVELFLKNKKRVCYGGTAINNILPLEAQFYDKKTELPDYDFFSPDPLKDAKSPHIARLWGFWAVSPAGQATLEEQRGYSLATTPGTDVFKYVLYPDIVQHDN